MSKPTLAALMVMASLAAIPVLASAQTFSSAGSSFTLSGRLAHAARFNDLCVATFHGVVSGDGTSATITSGSYAAGSFMCGYPIGPLNFPWTMTPGPGSSVTITGASFGPVDPCAGPITGSWTNGSPGKLTINNAALPAAGYGACHISGILNSTPSLSVN